MKQHRIQLCFDFDQHLPLDGFVPSVKAKEVAKTNKSKEFKSKHSQKISNYQKFKPKLTTMLNGRRKKGYTAYLVTELDGFLERLSLIAVLSVCRKCQQRRGKTVR